MSKLSKRFTSDGSNKFLKLLFPTSGLFSLKLPNGCHLGLLILVFCPNAPNPIFWLPPYIASVVMPNILPRFGNIITDG